MIKAFYAGFAGYGKALVLASRHRLWGYMIIPALLSLLLGAAILGAAWGISDDIGAWVVSFYPFEWGKGVLEKIARAFGILLAIALGLMLFRHLVMAIASPFMSFLSEKAERARHPGRSSPAFSIGKALRDLARGLRIALRNIIRELFFTLLVFIIGLFLPFLSPAVPVAIFIIQAFYAGFGNMDYALERHMGVRESIGFVRRHRGFAIGNGAVFLLLLFTGAGFLLALPLGTIAATEGVLQRMAPAGPA